MTRVRWRVGVKTIPNERRTIFAVMIAVGSEIPTIGYSDYDLNRLGTTIMKELFRVRITGKRQMTIPQRMMNVLDLAEGDELQFTVSGKQIEKTIPCKSVPTSLVTDDVAVAIAESRKEVKANKTGDAERLAKRMRKQGSHNIAEGAAAKTATL